MGISENSNRGMTRKIAINLSIAGFVLMLAHYVFLHYHREYNDENWKIIVDTTHFVEQADTIISIQPPYESKNIRLIGRSISHAGLKSIPPKRDSIFKRAMHFRAKQAGTYQTEIEYSLQFSHTPHLHTAGAGAPAKKHREYFLSDDEWLQLDNPALEAKIADIISDESDKEKIIESIFHYILKFGRHIDTSRRSVASILVTHSANHWERALLMVAMSRKAGVPARLVTGLELKEDPLSNQIFWVEVFLGDRWISYHPGYGYRDELPAGYVALDKTGNGIISGHAAAASASAGYTFTNEITIERLPVSISGADMAERRWYQVFMMGRLPSDAREELSLLMLLPLGALLCSLIRQPFGIHSYGVFTPTILALAMTYAEAVTTSLIIVVTLVLVYFGRPTFHHELSRTPRLSIIFTLVATSMVVGVSILDYFSLASDGHLVLLPIVIITSLIDRFYSAIEKFGHHTAIVRLVWTVILTLAVLPILQLEQLGGWIFLYPESHLFTLSLLILVSYYPFGKHKLPQVFNFLKEHDKKNVPDAK